MVTVLVLFTTASSEPHMVPGTWWTLGQHLFGACLRCSLPLNLNITLCLLYPAARGCLSHEVLQMFQAHLPFPGIPQFQAEPPCSTCSHYGSGGDGHFLKWGQSPCSDSWQIPQRSLLNE